jgi:hypothetical protein
MENEPWVARGSGRKGLDGKIQAKIAFVAEKLFAFDLLDMAKEANAVRENAPGNGRSFCGSFPQIILEWKGCDAVPLDELGDVGVTRVSRP